jgi:regulator of sigma E protease
LNWLPIGGFVKLEGEDGDSVEDPRSFAAQRWLTKMIILVAGVVMNILLAFAIFTAIALMGDPTVGLRIGAVQPDSPAAAAGIEPGDAVVSIDGTYYGAFDGVNILDSLQERAGETVALGILAADGTTETVTATLRTAEEVAAGRGALGVSELTATTTGVTIGHSVGEAIAIGAERTVDALGLILNGLGQLVDSVVNRPTQPPPVAGPVGIATQIGDVFWQLGPVVTLYMVAILSANLAVVNILPFPPLDGGRMLMITLKRVFGARISLRAEQLTYMVGFVFLFAFLIWVTGFDIVRGLSGGS